MLTHGGSVASSLVHFRKMIKAVIFDLGKVIIPFDFSRAYRAMAGLCPYSPEDIPKRIGSVPTDLLRQFESGQVEPEHFVEQLCGILEMPIEYGQLVAFFCSIFLADPLIPERMWKALRRRSRLLLLSNTNAIHFPMIQENYPLLRHFDDYILYYKVGAMEPSSRIYD